MTVLDYVPIPFGDRVKEARLALGLSQHQLAVRMTEAAQRSGEQHGFTDKAVSRWERGLCEPTTERFRYICIALEVSADWLLDILDEKGG